MLEFFDISAQCCDASNYLDIGMQCAQQGICYGSLRPIGNYYWFSIPYRTGSSPAILLSLNMFSMFVSIILSIQAMRWFISAGPNKSIQLFLLSVFCALTHFVYFYPTLFNTLSDPPANALFLSGVWLLLWAVFVVRRDTQAWLLFFAGISWGLAVLMRAFFLYPVLAGIVVASVWWIFSHRRKWSHTPLLVVLIPIAAQYAATYSVHKQLAFLPSESISSVTYMHLNSAQAGYDTYLPHSSYMWNPGICEADKGIINGIKAREFGDVVCVIASRLYFYLGTYNQETYLFPNEKQYLVENTSESVGDPTKYWWTNMEFIADVAVAPSGEKTADKLLVTTPDATGYGDIKQWISLKGDTIYTFSVWLWSPLEKTINIGITDYDNEFQMVAVRQVELLPQPQRFSVTGKTGKPGMYNIYIGKIHNVIPVTFGTSPKDYFLAWGAQVEASDHATEYSPDNSFDEGKIRKWRPGLLVVNIAAFILAFLFVYVERPLFFYHAGGLAILAALLTIFAEALAIIPEQRFAVNIMIIVWIFACMFLLRICIQKNISSSGAEL